MIHCIPAVLVRQSKHIDVKKILQRLAPLHRQSSKLGLLLKPLALSLFKKYRGRLIIGNDTFIDAEKAV